MSFKVESKTNRGSKHPVVLLFAFAALALFLSLSLPTAVVHATTLPVQQQSSGAGDATGEPPRLLAPLTVAFDAEEAYIESSEWVLGDTDPSPGLPYSYAWYPCAGPEAASCATEPVSDQYSVSLTAIAPARYVRIVERATNRFGSTEASAISSALDDPSASACRFEPGMRAAVYNPRFGLQGGAMKFDSSIGVRGDCSPLSFTAVADFGGGDVVSVPVTFTARGGAVNPYSGRAVGAAQLSIATLSYAYKQTGKFQPKITYSSSAGVLGVDALSAYGPVFVATRDQFCFAKKLLDLSFRPDIAKPVINVEGAPGGALDCAPPRPQAVIKRPDSKSLAVKVKNLKSGWVVRYEAGSIRGVATRADFKVRDRGRARSVKLWLEAPSGRKSVQPSQLKVAKPKSRR